MSRWESHNKNSKMTNTNNFVPWKHGHIVATELSRAQLWNFYSYQQKPEPGFVHFRATTHDWSLDILVNI